MREIEPVATNIEPGNKYAVHIEHGTGPELNKVPNVESIRQYYGVDEKIAWAIALSIRERGTPANPFVSKTFTWVLSKIDNWSSVFGDKIAARYYVS